MASIWMIIDFWRKYARLWNDEGPIKSPITKHQISNRGAFTFTFLLRIQDPKSKNLVRDDLFDCDAFNDEGPIKAPITKHQISNRGALHLRSCFGFKIQKAKTKSETSYLTLMPSMTRYEWRLTNKIQSTKFQIGRNISNDSVLRFDFCFLIFGSLS